MITIISDIDGVLIDSEKTVYEAYRQAFIIQGKKFTKRNYNYLLRNKPWRPKIFTSYYPTLDLDKLRKDKQRLYKIKRVIINWPLVSLLFFLQTQGNELILITGGSLEATKHKLANTELKPDRLICSCEKNREFFWADIKLEAKNSHLWLFDDDPKVSKWPKKLGIDFIQYKFKGNQNAS